MSASRTISAARDPKPITVRFDVVNLFDTIYVIRDGTGIGVFAPQFGPRRGFFLGIRRSSKSSHLKGYGHLHVLYRPHWWPHWVPTPPMVPAAQSDNSLKDLAEALDNMAKAISAIDQKLGILIARIGTDSSAVAIVAASLDKSK